MERNHLYFIDAFEKVVKVTIDVHNKENNDNILIVDLTLLPDCSVSLALSRQGIDAGEYVDGRTFKQKQFVETVTEFINWFSTLISRG